MCYPRRTATRPCLRAAASVRARTPPRSYGRRFSPTVTTGPPMVLDADALNILSAVPEWWLQLRGEAVVTPHPGEMSRLTGTNPGADQLRPSEHRKELRCAMG